MDTKNPNSKKKKLCNKLIRTPTRLLTKARDLYIKSMTEFSDRIGYGTVMGCPTGQIGLPRSYSVNSRNSDEDYMELLRAASKRDLSRLDRFQRQEAENNMPRSFSVGIGRIDEEKECEFDDDIKVKAHVFPRSRSYAVSGTTSAANSRLV